MKAKKEAREKKREMHGEDKAENFPIIFLSKWFRYAMILL